MSSVNVMTTNEEKCFQCQVVGHMARYCPHIKCYECDNYGHVAMDCPDKIQPSGMPACCTGLDTVTGARGHPPDTAVTQATHGMDTEDLDTVILDPDPTITATEAAAATIPAGVDPDHSIDLHTAISQETEAPVPITSSRDTPHHRQSTSRHTPRDDSRSRDRPRRQHYKPSQGSSWKSKDRKHKQVTIDDPPSDYYSSDDSNRSSDDDLN